MSKWRPEGWYRPFEKLCRDAFSLSTASNPVSIDTLASLSNLSEAYEAGADAMLEALRSNQLSPFDPTVMRANFQGKIVVIPDNKE